LDPDAYAGMFSNVDGAIVAKGLVNSREHLESLIVARDTGFATAQAYMRRGSLAAVD
jgi:hypothetical protein